MQKGWTCAVELLNQVVRSLHLVIFFFLTAVYDDVCEVLTDVPLKLIRSRVAHLDSESV